MKLEDWLRIGPNLKFSAVLLLFYFLCAYFGHVFLAKDFLLINLTMAKFTKLQLQEFILKFANYWCIRPIIGPYF